MSDFYVYIQLHNRFDLIRKAVDSIPEFWGVLTVVDNSPDGMPVDILSHATANIFRPPVPLTFVQSHNWWFKDAKERGAKFIIWMHSDAEAVDGGHLKLLKLARQYTAEGRKWYTIWTNYDSLAAVNLAAIDEVGPYDWQIPKYECDVDLSYRMRLAGWEGVDTGIHTKHLGSSTIKSDPLLHFTSDVVTLLSRQYYAQKWGGGNGNEKYTVPFNRPDLFPDLKPVAFW